MAADFEAAIESGSQALTGNHLVPVNLSKRQAFIAFICGCRFFNGPFSTADREHQKLNEFQFWQSILMRPSVFIAWAQPFNGIIGLISGVHPVFSGV